MFGKDLGKVWSRFKGVKRTNRQKVRKKKKEEKKKLRTRQGFGESISHKSIGNVSQNNDLLSFKSFET